MKRANLLLAGISVALAVLMAEVFLAWLDPPFFSPPVRIYDPLIGWRSRPGLVDRSSGVEVAVNSFGFRDREHAVAKAPGRKRLLVLGDSFTQANQVELEATWWSQLAGKLGPDWEAISLAASDYGTVQQMLLFEREGRKLAPDRLILQVFPLNDIFNNSRSAANLFSNQDAYRPYLEEDGSITYLAPFTAFWRRHSRLARMAIRLANHRFGWTWGGEAVWPDDQTRLAHTDKVALEMGYHEKLDRSGILLNVFAPEADQLPMVREGWQATDAAVARLVRGARAAGIEVWIAVFPHEVQLSPSLAWRRKYLPYPVDPRAAGQRLQTLVGDQARVIDLMDLFEAHLDEVRPYDQGHFNRAGHRLTAELLAAAMGGDDAG